MSKNLIIIESPSKSNSYKKALGSDYRVLSSYGHCIDLPKKKLGVDIKKDFTPTFEVLSDKKNVIKDIKLAAKKVDNIYLCMDQDREGEGIAKNIYDQIKNSTKAKIYRASTNEITKSGIQKAVQNAGQIDQKIFDSYLTRRILDRLVGFRASYPVKSATGGLSAGRVQSAILRIMVDRENEIINFVPEEYWILTAHFLSSKQEKYIGVLDKKLKVKNAQQAQDIYKKVIKGNPVISSVKEKNVLSKPVDPFTFIRMCGATSTQFGWSASKTMKVAQNIYQMGLCTYHRTDSRNLAQEAVSAIRDYIKENYASNYLPDKPFKYASKKGAQEAHEACRPTDIGNVNPQNLDLDQQKLYTMIWKRTISCQMNPGQDKSLTVITEVSGYNFISQGKTPIFDGYRKVWDYSSPDYKNLPLLFEGEKIILEQLIKEQKFTLPPNRYNTASLGSVLEKLQIARPATFANFLEILKNRKYIESGKNFRPTHLGMDVIKFMKQVKFCFIDTEFTAKMEELLDGIASGDSSRVQVLSDFWKTLRADIENSKKIKKENETTKYKCPKCGAFLMLKHSQYGKFYSCSEYKPKGKGCNYKAQIGEHGEPVEKSKAEKVYLNFVCQKCGSKMIKRKSKFGEFAGCTKYPACSTMADLDGNFKESKKKKKWGKKKT